MAPDIHSGSNVTTIVRSPVARDVFVLPSPELSGGVLLLQALKNRKSSHSFGPLDISNMQLSSLLWAANGVNRRINGSGSAGMRTAPSVKNYQEIELYVFIVSGIYRYDSQLHHLELICAGDFRKDCGMQAFFAEAPLAICLVANFSRMGKMDEKKRDFYSGTDAGYVSQNIYLYCASQGIATTACGLIDRKLLHHLLHLEDAKAMLSHPFGGL